MSAGLCVLVSYIHYMCPVGPLILEPGPKTEAGMPRGGGWGQDEREKRMSLFLNRDSLTMFMLHSHGQHSAVMCALGAALPPRCIKIHT